MTKVGPLINNGDLKLPNGRYSKNHKKFSKILVSSDLTRGPTFKKYDFSDKNVVRDIVQPVGPYLPNTFPTSTGLIDNKGFNNYRAYSLPIKCLFGNRSCRRRTEKKINNMDPLIQLYCERRHINS